MASHLRLRIFKTIYILRYYGYLFALLKTINWRYNFRRVRQEVYVTAAALETVPDRYCKQMTIRMPRIIYYRARVRYCTRDDS